MRPGFLVTLTANRTANFQLFSPLESVIKIAHQEDLCTVILLGKIYYKKKSKLHRKIVFRQMQTSF